MRPKQQDDQQDEPFSQAQNKSLADASKGRSPVPHELPRRVEDGTPFLHHPPSGMRFLAAAHGLESSAIYRYDDAGRDVSVRYAKAHSIAISAYVFPFPAPRNAQTFEDELSAAIADMLATQPAYQEADERRVAFAHATQAIITGRRYELLGPAWKGSDKQGIRRVELYAVGAWLLKIRATLELSARPQLEAFLSTFLKASALGAP